MCLKSFPFGSIIVMNVAIQKPQRRTSRVIAKAKSPYMRARLPPLTTRGVWGFSQMK